MVLLYQITVFIIHRKTWKVYTKTIHLKYHLQHGMMNLNYQMDHVLYKIFKRVYYKHGENIDNPSIRLYK